MEKTRNNTTRTASIYPNPKTGQQKTEYHVPPKSPSGKLAATIAAPENNHSYEEESPFIKR